MSMLPISKHPADVIDVLLDWTAWLAGDEIATYACSATTGLTVVSTSALGAVVAARVSGGADGEYYLRYRITTYGGRETVQSVIVQVRSL